ncbi:HigA family addiction module antitoxin [Dyadobacter sp. CY343]|uniref:HigA family addiction module antitoxin n=1 Tax=Dyadobacter sp. CY343 TaxID=2907299 RepID=UPI001F37F721|nr:HigA family addiction module antitoxin [Dyadobacter sp. CY343]MCE7063159.1 HigA family addiction module antitoxin [Dyadobacter sp. CY343]
MILFDPPIQVNLSAKLLTEFMRKQEKRLTVEQVAAVLGTTRKTLSAIINGKSAVSPEMAIRLGAAFPNTTAEFWLGVQENYNLAQARKRVDASKVNAIWRPNGLLPA